MHNWEDFQVLFLVSECCFVLEFMASLSDLFRLSTRVANSLHMQFLNTPGVLCRVFLFVSRLPTSPRWTSPQAKLRYAAYSNGGDSNNDYTLAIAACATGKRQRGEKMIVFCAISEFDTCTVTYTNLHQCECICCYHGSRYCRYPF